jgi:hypothetical protein
MLPRPNADSVSVRQHVDRALGLVICAAFGTALARYPGVQTHDRELSARRGFPRVPHPPPGR